jgi:hypothetical protein
MASFTRGFETEYAARSARFRHNSPRASGNFQNWNPLWLKPLHYASQGMEAERKAVCALACEHWAPATLALLLSFSVQKKS